MFPTAFVGRGDMSRGGLLLRQARAGVELDYVPVRAPSATARGRRSWPPIEGLRDARHEGVRQTYIPAVRRACRALHA